ncbi:Hypothetical_protein [Hexamita inflata]|uniref:Hypothetical_protein n=1 Tax=Hexamita inflata TaxID=28002 RepID=A0AA86QYE8_9EUKA|nr:Hypothetical protein HINF_LOCUS56044 [Hexamita inflata]
MVRRLLLKLVNNFNNLNQSRIQGLVFIVVYVTTVMYKISLQLLKLVHELDSLVIQQLKSLEQSQWSTSLYSATFCSLISLNTNLQVSQLKTSVIILIQYQISQPSQIIILIQITFFGSNAHPFSFVINPQLQFVKNFQNVLIYQLTFLELSVLQQIFTVEFRAKKLLFGPNKNCSG